MKYKTKNLTTTDNSNIEISLPEAFHWQSDKIVSFPIRDDYGISQALKYRGFFKGKRDEFIVNIYVYETEQVLRPIDRLIIFNSYQNYGYTEFLYEKTDTACAKFKKLDFADTGNEKTSTVFYDECNVIVIDIVTDIEKVLEYAEIHEKIRASLKFVPATPYSCILKSDTNLSNVEILPNTIPFTFILPFNWSYEREGEGDFSVARFVQRSIDPSTPNKVFSIIEVAVYNNSYRNHDLGEIRERFQTNHLSRWIASKIINEATEIDVQTHVEIDGKTLLGFLIEYEGGAPNNFDIIATQKYVSLSNQQIIVASALVKYERESQIIEDYDRLDTFAIAAQGRLIQDIILRQLIQIYDNKKEN